VSFKPAHVTASVNTGMSMSSSRIARARFHAKLMSMAMVGLVVLAIVVGLVFWLAGGSHSKSPAKGVVKTPPANTDAEQRAQYYADTGQYEQSEQTWEAQLASAATASDKVAIYYQQAAVAIRYKQYSDARKYANDIKQIAPDAPDSYVVLAQLAKAQNNIPQAKQYWQQAIDHVNVDTPAGKMVRSDYINQMDALK